MRGYDGDMKHHKMKENLKRVSNMHTGIESGEKPSQKEDDTWRFPCVMTFMMART